VGSRVRGCAVCWGSVCVLLSDGSSASEVGARRKRGRRGGGSGGGGGAVGGGRVSAFWERVHLSPLLPTFAHYNHGDHNDHLETLPMGRERPATLALLRAQATIACAADSSTLPSRLLLRLSALLLLSRARRDDDPHYL
jgi:hypothetical protein